MKALMPVIHEVGDSFIEYLNRPDLKKNDLDAKELTQVCVVEILSRIGCGVKPNILDDKVPEENKFYQVLRHSLSFFAKFVLISEMALLSQTLS